jgi:hypothetical protein
MAAADRLSWRLPFLPMRWLMTRAVRLHQEFKFKVVACWPEGERWWITTDQIAAVVNLIEQENVQAAKKNDQVQGSEAAGASTTAAFSTGGSDAA